MSYAYRPAPRRWLVCLDLTRDGALRPAAVIGCRRTLALARASDWRVIHLYRQGETVRPLPGLGPLPSEAVLLRAGLSALSSPAFRQMLAGAPGVELVLVGSDMAGAGLATALGAADHGARTVLVHDAFADAAALQAVATLLAVHSNALSVEPLERLDAELDFIRQAANQP